MHGRWPLVKDFCGVVDCAWFSGKSEDLSSATVDDTIWAILRMNPLCLLKTTILETRQIVPSWSAFNAILYPDTPCTTNIGYCPLLDDSTEFSTVYTVMKHGQQIRQRVGQFEAVITSTFNFTVSQAQGNSTQVSCRVFQHIIKLSRRAELSLHNRKEAPDIRLRRPANRVRFVCGW